MELTSHLLRQIRKLDSKYQGVSTSFSERCGIIVDHSKFGPHLFEVPNRAEKPLINFRIWRVDLEPILEEGHPIKAIFHTHLGEEEDGPSTHDRDQLRMLRRELPFVVGIVYVVPLGLIVEYSDKEPDRRLLISTKE